MKKISTHIMYDFKSDIKEFSSKEEMALNWFISFREYLLKNKLAEFGDILPSKADISKLLNISTGTVSNALKYAEDMGFFISKQCIGTMIADENKKNPDLKMISKKDRAYIEIKKFLIKEKYEENEFIPNISFIANEIKTSPNTTRLAVNELIQRGILRREIYDEKPVLILNNIEKLMEQKEKTGISEIKNKNLVKIVKENIKKYILQNLKPQDKIPTGKFFADYYKVSIRTINSAFKELNKEKFILSRRGNYGSVFLGAKNSEKSMFMSKPGEKKSLAHSYNYKWEYSFENIKKYILKNYEAGDKIPSMRDLAKTLGVSISTIKKAAAELNKQGILFTQKGKYGGLFIMEMPQKEDLYQWVIINPDYLS